MKKTLITLLALGGVAMAVEPTVTLNDTTSSVTGKSWDGTGYMLTLMSADDFSSLITATEDVSLLSFSLNNSNSVGVGLVDNTFKGVTASAGETIPGTTYWSMNTFSSLTTTFSETVLDNISQVGIAMTYDRKNTASTGAVNGIQLIVYTLGTDGVLSDAYTGNVGEVRWAGATINGAAINTDYFDSVDVYVGDWTTEGVKGQLKSMLVPEPATATLSLLALAGLAMRRRRK
ncbi:MAG: PEP-CTERM sorting domain-containing protein [Akkermansia sp.]|nr:PEP-CTERM sorting domain-containing protein [Akkermansia sp.]